MKTFKAKHNKGWYKSTEKWLDAVYRNNESVIRKELGFTGKPKAVFKQMVHEYMEEGMSPTKAVNTIARSTIFTSESERLRNNAYQGLKSDKAMYQRFRELTKERGKYARFDESKLKWDKKEGYYVYNNSVIISFQNSPFGVLVRGV